MSCKIIKKKLIETNISVTTYDEVVSVVIEEAKNKQLLKFTALDAHGLWRSAKDKQYRNIVNSFDIVSPDGHSLKWGLNQLYGAKLKDRVAGPDLTVKVCQAAAADQIPIYLYGSRRKCCQTVSVKIAKICPDLVVAGIQPSRFRPLTNEEDQYDMELIRNSGARIVLVGLGCPLQEQWIYDHGIKLSMPMLAIGAAFDFISGNKPRAPKWIRDSGFEWAFRILSEPRRLIRRSVPSVAFVFVTLLTQYIRLLRTKQR